MARDRRTIGESTSIGSRAASRTVRDGPGANVPARGWAVVDRSWPQRSSSRATPRVPGVTSRAERQSSERGTLFRRPQKLRPLHHLVLCLLASWRSAALRGDDVGGNSKLACRPRRADVAVQPQELATGRP